MLHASQPFFPHHSIFTSGHFRDFLPKMDTQDAPLNLSCRKTPESAERRDEARTEVACNVTTLGGWSVIQSPVFVSKTTPWCCPWPGYPFVQISDRHYQQAYWNLVNNFLKDRIQATVTNTQPTASSSKEDTSTSSPSLPLTHIEPKPRSLSATEISDSSACSSVQGEVITGIEDKQKQKPRKIQSPTKSSFKCSQCGVSYPHRFELNRHVKVSHVRPHRCEHCGKGFGHKNYLQVHIETVHLGRKSHKCDLCGKYLSTGGNLSVHVRTIHMGEKKYKCSVCSRTFGQQCNMKTHMKRHFFKQGDKRASRNNSC